MNAIELIKINNDRKAFVIEENGERLAEMELGIRGSDMIVYHTEVSEKLRGKGVANQLLDEMTSYARKNSLKVVPLCRYVLAEFTRHPDQYKDIWNKDWHNR